MAREGDPEHPDLRNIVITGPPDNVREAKRQVLLIADVSMKGGVEILGYVGYAT